MTMGFPDCSLFVLSYENERVKQEHVHRACVPWTGGLRDPQFTFLTSTISPEAAVI